MLATLTAVDASAATHRRYGVWLGFTLLALGTVCRLGLALRTFLNPDEALHYFIAAQPTLSQTYTASLTTAHPPLMFLLLHGWMNLGTSEFMLRLPFVIAGALFSWMMFLWVVRIAGRDAGLFALVLALFSPSLISLTAEVRQYSLMLLGCAACLYCQEYALQTGSWRFMTLSAVALWTSLLTHYSALIFAASAGIYALLRFPAAKQARAAVKAAWAVGQVGAWAICGILFKTQVSKLRQSGLPSEIAASWLSSSIFHPGQDHMLSFAASKTARLFRYFVSHGTVGVLMLALFCVAVVALLHGGRPQNVPKSCRRPLAVLFVLPFLLTLATAIAGIYPYGGTRHDIVLVLFSIPAIAVGLDLITISTFRVFGVKLLVLLALLAICSLFPAPTGPFIRPHNQNRRLMAEAIFFLHAQPAGSTVLTDYQGGLVLGYYLCGRTTTLPFGQTPTAVLESGCDDYRLLTRVGSQGGFELQQLPPAIEQAWSTVSPATSTVWLFQTGWIEDEGTTWMAELLRLGCESVHDFGPNVRICPLKRTSMR